MDNYSVNVNKKAIALCMVFAILVGIFPFFSTNVYASGVDNITSRADYLYNILWTAQKDVKGWGNATTFKQGTTHHIPYGQPVNSGKFICWGATIDTFLTAAADASSVFYSTQSYYSGTSGSYSTYYAMDCSSFASFCWGLTSRTTTAGWSNLSVTNYGKCTNENVGKIQQGDALNSANNHIVIISRVSDGKYEVTEQTPPEMKRTWYTSSQLVSKYSGYIIYRYNNRDSVSPPPTTNSQVDWDITKPDTYPVYPNDYFSISHNNTNSYYVKFIQSGLKALGHTIDVDGSYGYSTQAVVKRFQSYNGLEADGEFGPASWSKMVELLKNKFQPSAPTKVTLSVNKTQFKKGETAIFTFSGNNNPAGYSIEIIHDGSRICKEIAESPYSFQLLFEGNYSAYVNAWNSEGNCNSNTVTFSIDSETIPDKPTPRYSPDTSTYKVSYSRALYVRDGWAVNDRMHGDDVKYMQACLYYLGYNIEIDGWYGSGTASVVKQFQVHYGLTADGDCGPATWPAIEKAVADNPKPTAPTNVKINVNATSFTVGDTVKFSFSADNNPKGYTIGIDKDGTRIITKDVNNPFSISTLEAGSYSAYVTSWNDYGGNDSNRVYFTVNPKQPKLSSVSIKSKPSKLIYTVGETLATSGLKLTAAYSDNSTKEISSGFTYTPIILNTAGTQKITVTYNGKTTSFDVTVNPAIVDTNALKINVSSANAKAGDEVSVIISLADNPGFNYMKLKVKYDKNAMSLSSTESLNLLDGFSYIPGSNTASNPYVLSWGAAGDSKKNGNLVKLTFKISANAGEGEYPITLICEDCSNQNDQDVKNQITSGKVSINNKIIGDVNGDGKINGKDATLLMKYLAEWDVTIDESTSDVNKDGKINGKDATLLMKFLAEWDVTLG